MYITEENLIVFAGDTTLIKSSKLESELEIKSIKNFIMVAYYFNDISFKSNFVKPNYMSF